MVHDSPDCKNILFSCAGLSGNKWRVKHAIPSLCDVWTLTFSQIFWNIEKISKTIFQGEYF